MSISLSAFADRLNDIIPVVMKGISRHQSNELFKGKITLPQFLILDFLNKHGEAKMKDLAVVMDVTTAAMTGMVDRLVKYNYVQRIYEPEDRRIIKINLTLKGKEMAERMKNQRLQAIKSIFVALTEHDREEYLRIITKVLDFLTQEEVEKLKK